MTTDTKIYRAWSPETDDDAVRIEGPSREDAARRFAVAHLDKGKIRWGHDWTRTVAVSDDSGTGVQVFDVTVSIAVAEAVTS